MNVLEWDIGIAAFSEFDGDQYQGVQVNPIGGKSGGLAPFEVHSPYGFSSRPHDPDIGADGAVVSGCTVLYAWEGNQNGHAWVQSDPRITPRLPQFAKGSSVQYGAPSPTAPLSFAVINAGGEDPGSWTAYVAAPDLTQGSYVKLSPVNGFELSTPWGWMKLGPLGFDVQIASGPAINMGSVAGLPFPLDTFTCYASMSAPGIVSLKGAMTSLGQDGGLANGSAVEALKVLTDALNATLIAVNAAIATAVEPSGITGANKTALATATATMTAAFTAFQAVANGIGKAV